jgi:uncharacterized membrane protein YccC
MSFGGFFKKPILFFTIVTGLCLLLLFVLLMLLSGEYRYSLLVAAFGLIFIGIFAQNFLEKRTSFYD